MLLSEVFKGSQTPFEGDHTLLLRGLPNGAQVNKATVRLKPVAPSGAPLFEEVIHPGSSEPKESWGATLLERSATSPASGSAEVDFHTRRTLASVSGSGLDNANLYIELGGVYMPINQQGAIDSPDDDVDLFELPADRALPGLTVSKFKLAVSGSPHIETVTVRSAPSNLTLRLGDQPAFWARPGELAYEVTSSDFATILSTYLSQAEVDGGNYLLPLILHSDTIARLDVEVIIEYVQVQPMLPDDLNETTLEYDYSSLPAGEASPLHIEVPVGAHVLPKVTTARVQGSFENSQIVYGPSGALPTAGETTIKPDFALAQPLIFHQDMAASGFDILIIAETRSASLSVDLVEDVDGKPWNTSLLPTPVSVRHDSQVQGAAQWVHADFPGEVQLTKNKRVWLVVQSLSGEVSWSVDSQAGVNALVESGSWMAGASVAGDSAGMQYSQNGGLSWRAASAPGISGPLVGYARLRHSPSRYIVPVDLQVGQEPDARRVKLDRFQPLGRVDFRLDFDEVAQSINEVLDITPAPPQGELIANGDMDFWRRVGDLIMQPVQVPVTAQARCLALTPDGNHLYLVSLDTVGASLEVFDIATRQRLNTLFIGTIGGGSSQVPQHLVVSPDGRLGILVVEHDGGFGYLIIDMQNLQFLVQIGSSTSARPVFSPDSKRLYLPTARNGDQPKGVVVILPLDPSKAVSVGKDKQPDAIVIGNNLEPLSMALSPDERWLYVVVEGPVDSSGTNNDLRIYDTQTRQQVGESIPLGDDPRHIALRPDGEQAVITNGFERSVNVVDTYRRSAYRLDLGSYAPVSTAADSICYSPDGKRIFIACENSETAGVSAVVLALELDEHRIQSFQVGDEPLDLAISPLGERLYVADHGVFSTGPVFISAVSFNRYRTEIPIGALVPAEWTLTAGKVWRVGVEEPYGLAALLGDFIAGETTHFQASGLSQVVPIVGGFHYRLDFWGVASDSQAVGEVFWIDPQQGVLQVDSLPLHVMALEDQDPLDFYKNVALGRKTDGVTDYIHFHRLEMDAPLGATLAEVRFNVPSGQAAGLDRISFQSIQDRLTNGDFQVEPDGSLAGWQLLPPNAPGVLLHASEQGLNIQNNGGAPAALVQTVDFPAEQHFELKLEATDQPAALPRLDLTWLDKNGHKIGMPASLEVGLQSPQRQVLRGISPTTTRSAQLSLAVPANAHMLVKRVALELVAMQRVPLTFVAQAPGELRLSEMKVVYEIAPPAPAPLPPEGLWAATPPGRQPGETPLGCCYCACCCNEGDLQDSEAVETPAGQPALAGFCPTCGAHLIHAGSGEMPARPQRPEAAAAQVFVVPRRIEARRKDRLLLQPAEMLMLPPLIDVEHIGPRREELLAEMGIRTVLDLALAPVELVADLRGISLQMAENMVAEARRMVGKVRQRPAGRGSLARRS